jgi:uncharacterized protein YceH (UPF0502 family)
MSQPEDSPPDSRPDGPPPLNAEEARVLGALMEKERLTPDTYPLSLNSLVTACNQSTSRDPVVDYDEAVVTRALDGLASRRWAQSVISSGNRVTKFRQLLTINWSLSEAEAAVLSLLLLRGPQTPGELKSRSGRLHEFGDLAEVEAVLERLSEVRYPPRTQRLERQPGMKEARYAHTLCGEPVAAAHAPAALSTAERISRLEEEVAQLREDLQLFRRQFE